MYKWSSPRQRRLYTITVWNDRYENILLYINIYYIIIIWYNIVLSYVAISYRYTQNCIIWHETILLRILYDIVSHDTIAQHDTISYNKMMYRLKSYCIIWKCIILYDIVSVDTTLMIRYRLRWSYFGFFWITFT